MPLMPWQKFILNDMMKVDGKGNFRRKTNLLLIARQNGKTHLATMLILWNLVNGKRVVALSSSRLMALDTYRNVVHIIESNEFLRKQLNGKPRMANGQEHVSFKNGGRYEIVAATRDGARGRGAGWASKRRRPRQMSGPQRRPCSWSRRMWSRCLLDTGCRPRQPRRLWARSRPGRSPQGTG